MAKHRVVTVWLPVLLVATSLFTWAGRPNAPEQSKLVETTLDRDYLMVQPNADLASYNVVLSGPSGRFEYTFSGGETAILDTFAPDGALLIDGLYKYEIRLSPAISQKRARGAERTDAPGLEPVSGVFTIRDGEIVMPELERSDAGIERVLGKGGQIDFDDPNRDQVIADDLIVQNSACIGFDCVNGESFGFDTLRLKENNLRIRFMDTSNSGSFPTRDWQLTANDTTNGGQDRFSIDDIDGGRTPFTIEASAPSHSLYVDDGGRIGVGTMNPVVELHVIDGDTPTLRLEQDGSSGFTAQTWDVASNETNFFVRDATNGSRLPFKIRPSAPTNSLYVDTDGDIGLGTQSPGADMHLVRSDGNTQLLIQDSMNPTPGDNTLIRLEGATRAAIRLSTTSNAGGATDWDFLNGTLGFRINDAAGAPEFEIQNGGKIILGDNGNDYVVIEEDTGTATEGDVTILQDLTVSGVINGTVSSDVNMKEEFEAVDPIDVLDKLIDVPVLSYKYTHEEDARHMGVMAQDFYATFGLGKNDTSLSLVDPAGVNTAAIQGLNQKLELKVSEKEDELALLREENRVLTERLEKLEALVNGLVDQKN